ncbi:hypothetical protein FPV67DRAFT_775169 [Lyophyllum atratum]|nr:hypothetical protein FPV67DRAFT_775169 [Lyophyllum atratum]
MDDSKRTEYVATLQVLQIQGFINAAGITLWVYDYLGTFPLEVTLIWRAPWKIPKVLFILTRYLPVVAFGVLLYYDVAHLSAEECQTCQKVVIWIFNIGICIAEMIFTIRTWAVWERGRKMGIFLAIFSLAIWASHFILMALLLPSVQPVFYLVTLSLMSIRAYQCLGASRGSTSLLNLVFFDGILYYISLFSASLVIIAIDFAVSPAYASTLSRIQHILCTVLACRMLLHLRAQGACTSRSTNFQKFGANSACDLDSIVFRWPDLDTIDHELEQGESTRPNAGVLVEEREVEADWDAWDKVSKAKARNACSWT